MSFKKRSIIFSQGDASESVFFIQSGRVKLSVVSGNGKEAILGLLGEHHFVGENGLTGQVPHMASAVAVTDCVLMRIDKKAMTLAMRQDSTLTTLFVQHLLERSIQQQEDLVDQLFNSSEKRLARTLLLLAGPSQNAASGSVIPKLSQESLAEMVGTTRARVSLFLNRFRKRGLIDYNAGGDLYVWTSRLRAVLPDDNPAGSLVDRNLAADENRGSRHFHDPEAERLEEPPTSGRRSATGFLGSELGVAPAHSAGRGSSRPGLRRH